VEVAEVEHDTIGAGLVDEVVDLPRTNDNVSVRHIKTDGATNGGMTKEKSPPSRVLCLLLSMSFSDICNIEGDDEDDDDVGGRSRPHSSSSS